MTTAMTTQEIWPLNNMLSALIRERDAAESDEEKAAADEAIQLFVRAELVERPDTFIAYLKHCEAQAEVANKEANRIAAICRRWTRRKENLEAFVLGALIETKQKEIEGEIGTFTQAKNPPSVEITDASLIPEKMCQYTGTISGWIWRLIDKFCRESVYRCSLVEFMRDCPETKMDRAPMKIKIAAEMRKPCPTCKGFTDYCADVAICEDCNGTGKRVVPGARWINDRVRLVVK